MHLKTRIFAIILILASCGLTYYNWHQLSAEHRYSLKLAVFAPLCLIAALFVLAFPSMAGKPSTAKEKFIVLIVSAIGLAAGLVNLYLMDPGFFGR
jgi:CDP-diglyceride synthetase